MNWRARGAVKESATTSCEAIFISTRGSAGLRAAGGDTSGSFSRKSYHTSLLACGAMVSAYKDFGFSYNRPEATQPSSSPWVSTESTNGAGLGRANMLY